MYTYSIILLKQICLDGSYRLFENKINFNGNIWERRIHIANYPEESQEFDNNIILFR